MSVKRGAERYLTKDDVSDPRMQEGGPDDRSDPVKRATAAQLANRKIKAAKGRGARPGAGASTARPTTSFGPSPSTSQSGLFSNAAQSFPPTNGAPPIGNGSSNVSFGGFGSGSADTGFAFSPSVTVNNPFANVSTSNTNNGASNGGFGFNFGGSQPAATPPSTGIFSFGGNQQQAPNPFSSATPQAPSTGIFGSSNAPSSTIFGTPAASTTPAGGIFGSTNGGSAFGSTNGTGMFGSTSSTSQQPSGGSAFGQPPTEAKSEASPQSFFGTTAPAVKSPFGQHNDDVMSTSPDASPQKGAHNSISKNWNKSLEVPGNGLSSNSSSNGEESPDHPHIEEEPRPNPFAMIPRAKSSEPPKAVETPVKSSFNTEKKQEKEQSQTEDGDETPRANPFASISRKAQSTPKPADPTPKPSFLQSSNPATSNMFGKSSTDPVSPLASSTNSSTPAKTSIFSSNVNSPAVKQPRIVQQSPIVGKDESSRPSNLHTFGSSTTKPSTNIFGLASKSTQPTTAPTATEIDSATSARMAEVGTVYPQDRLGSDALSRHLSADFRSRVLAEHSLSMPSADSGMDAEETKYWVREHKLNRLNSIYKHFFEFQGKESNFEAMDLRPMMANYITLFEEIMVPIEGPLTTLIAQHGKDQGTRLHHQQNGSMPDESGKRKPGAEVPREDETPKKIRIEAPLPASVTQTPPPPPPPSQSSATANKFMDFLNKTDNPTDNTTSSTPANNLTQKPAAVEAPTFKLPTFAPTGNAMAQFGENAAKAAAAAKQKAKDEDYDSDDETEAEWERKYEEKLAAKAAELKKLQQNSGFGFKVNASSSTTPPVTNGGFGFKAKTSASALSLAPQATNGGFNFSRSVSPAASASGSVFDTGRPNTLSGSGNIFGHLSNAGSDVEGSARGDADDEDSDEDGAQQTSTPKASNNQPNGKFGGFTESDDAPSDSATSGRSLFDRIEKRSEAPTPAPARAPPITGNLFGFPISTEKSTSALSGGMFGSRDESSERAPLAVTTANEGGIFGFGTKPATAGSANGGGLFGFGTTSSPPAPAKEGGLFGFGSQSTTSSAGDQTWKPDSPIKFNGSSTEAPKFSFVASTPKSVPSTGFSFSPIAPTPSGATTGSGFSGFGTPGSSLFGVPKSSGSLFVPSGSSSILPSGVTSRATTPGVSDVSGAETGGEQEEISNDPQSDLIGMEAAKKGHDVLFEQEKVKASRYDVDPTGKKQPAWATQGVGPIAILKDQASGVTKILMKRVPNGGIVINTRLMASMTYQQIAKRVRFGVIDPATGKMEQLIVQVSSEDEAKKFVEVCDAHKNQ